LADLNPLSLWRRFLALPNDSRTKTLVVAFLVSSICAVLVTTATVMLRPIQAQNRAAEQQARLEALVAAVPGISALLEEAGDAALSTVVIDLETGAAAKSVTPETLETALADPANWTTLSATDDIAGIGSRPNYAQIYLLRSGETVRLAILPVVGSGYGGRIQALLALNGDMQTLAGLAVTEQSETPGLGARIAEAPWQQGFAGKRLFDDTGAARLAVARGPARGEHEVDGITGATRTGNAVTQMVRFWVGPKGYGSTIAALRRGDF
jgi:NADH:ubiquinone oxidoreductase, Na(+)-translocating, C subunit